jgi:NTE family protein
MTTAFVLSGGGSLGAVQVGMLQALADRGIRPDLLIGTSAGAVNAAFVAGPGVWPDGLGELAQVWTELRRGDVFPIQPAHELLALSGFRSSLCSDRGIRRLVDAHLAYRRLEDAAIPVHVVATDLITGMETLFSTGEARSAILASCAIPGVFPPVARGGSTYVDGGLADNAAISQAVNLGADTIYVLPGGNACALTRAPTHPVAIALQALTLLIQNQLIRDVAHYASRASLIVLPPLCPLEVAPLDFGRARQLIDRARGSTIAWLDSDRPQPKHPERLLALHDHRGG